MTDVEAINWLREYMGRDDDVNATVKGVMNQRGFVSFGDFVERDLEGAVALAEGLKDMVDQDEELNDKLNAYKEVQPKR